MPYATVNDLLERASAQDLAEIGGREFPAVDGEALREHLADPLRPADADLRDQVVKAVARLQDAVDTASAEVDSYARSKHPDIGENAIPTALKVYTVDIAIYRLFGGDRNDERFIRYDNALKWLRALAKGEIDLAPTDVDGAPGGEILIASGQRVFDDRSLGPYTELGANRGAYG